MVRKNFKFTVITFPENALNLGVLTNASPLPNQNSPLVFIISSQAEQNYLYLQTAFFRESVSPQQQKRGGGNYDLLQQNSIRKYEDDLEH